MCVCVCVCVCINPFSNQSFRSNLYKCKPNHTYTNVKRKFSELAPLILPWSEQTNKQKRIPLVSEWLAITRHPPHCCPQSTSCSSSPPSPRIAVRNPFVLPVPALLSIIHVLFFQSPHCCPQSTSCSSSPLIAVQIHVLFFQSPHCCPNPCPVLPVPSLLSIIHVLFFQSPHCCPNPCPVPSAGIAVQIHVLFLQPALLSTIPVLFFQPALLSKSMSCSFSRHYCPQSRQH